METDKNSIKSNRLIRASNVLFVIFFISLVIFAAFHFGLLHIKLRETTILFIRIFGSSGTLALFIGSFLYTLNDQLHILGKQNKFLAYLKSFIFAVVFPFYLIVKFILYLSNKKKVDPETSKKKSVSGLMLLIIPVWFIWFIVAGLNIFTATTFHEIVNMGNSMSPTIKDGYDMYFYYYHGQELHHGDIISFYNESVKSVETALGKPNSNQNYGLLKRIVALPGDTIKFKGGIVFVNGKPIDEPYTLEPNSTYSIKVVFNGNTYGDFLPECETVTVPKDKVFVLSDDRSSGLDSRYFGFVNFKDIKSVLPFSVQEGVVVTLGSNDYKKDWRSKGSTLTQEALSNVDKDNCQPHSFYSQEEIDYWNSQKIDMDKLASNLNSLKNNTNYYQQNKTYIDQLEVLFQERIALINKVLSAIKSNQGFTDSEQEEIYKADKDRYNQFIELTKKLSK